MLQSTLEEVVSRSQRERTGMQRDMLAPMAQKHLTPARHTCLCMSWHPFATAMWIYRHDNEWKVQFWSPSLQKLEQIKIRKYPSRNQRQSESGSVILANLQCICLLSSRAWSVSVGVCVWGGFVGGDVCVWGVCVARPGDSSNLWLCPALGTFHGPPFKNCSKMAYLTLCALTFLCTLEMVFN